MRENSPPDPCMAPPRNPGQGEAHATRWAFEGTTRKCVPFEYRGMKGNANNFQTRESCETRCPVFENPCKVGEAYSVNNQYYQCSPQNVCPAGHYCHIGKDANYCCQALGGDPCGQPMDRGQGVSQLARWFWNQQQQCCSPFSYCGQKGTQNNFLNKEDCERTCYELDNPCALGEPQMIPQTNRPIQCSIQSNTCSGDFWCHFGANAQTTVCCPHREEGDAICRQPMTQGTGDAQLPRWYYDAQNRRCIQFTYRGREGNQNNFLTQEACEQQCPAYVNVCPTGNPLLDNTNKPVPCTFGSNSCGSDHWCHQGLVPDEYQCCPGTPTQPGACQGLSMNEGQLGAPAPAATRYYYDQQTQTCLQFIYNGRKGNQNNFLTLEDCEETCDVFVNPCNQPISLPAQLCSANGPNTCGPSAWCHIGATSETTLCCPSEGDACSLPLSRGTGNQFVDRWFYNQQTATCQPFTYAGLQGNQNNFLTRESCEERCGPNPCFEGRPFAGIDGRPQTCSVSANLNTCPANHWCHIGADSSTTVCCQGLSTNICNLPMSTGEGSASLERFYYDQSSRTCRPFIYNGLKGNQNNFVSLRSCQLSCQPLDNPCIGQPATTAAGQVLFCSSTNKDACPVNFWCHLGATPETTVCCPGATNPCSVPLAPGTGNAGLSRWYYNPDDRQCLPFQYNGKRGNQNNFEVQSDCERTCPVFHNPCITQVEMDSKQNPKTCNPLSSNSTCASGYFCLGGDPMIIASSVCCARINQDSCQTPMTEGFGTSTMTRYYYNPLESDCLPFNYRGKKGNENNFLTLDMCRERCKPVTNVCFGGQAPLKIDKKIIQCDREECPSSHFCHIGSDSRTTVCCLKQSNPCDEQLMKGVGDSQLSRFYYDSVDDECKPFIYYGIGGNENNFLTKEHCQITCPGYRGYCPHGKPLVANQTIVTCGIDKACPSGNVCHVSRKNSKTICCPDPSNFCLLPTDKGHCSEKHNRFAYDKSTGVCTSFSYGGCQGNLNNFDSLQKCTEVCCDKEELCLLSIDRGACNGRQTRYAFNRQTSQCVPFDYTGCGGNLNNFATLADCMDTCGNVGFRR